MALSAPLLRLTPLLALLPLLFGCGQKNESRELRVLREANESLRQRLTAAEEALAQARADLERHEQSAPAEATDHAPATPPAAVVGNAPAPAPPENAGAEDTTYIVIGKHHVPGQFIPQPTGSDPSAAKRTPPVYQVTFRGEQSSRVYPPLNVAELAYPRFREGASYSRAALNAAKAGGNDPVTAPPPAPIDGGALPPIDFDSIFGPS